MPSVATAELQVKAIVGVVQELMMENRRLPTWKDLITPDDRGFSFVERDNTALDPWAMLM